jgi:hypothetical protein
MTASFVERGPDGTYLGRHVISQKRAVNHKKRGRNRDFSGLDVHGGRSITALRNVLRPPSDPSVADARGAHLRYVPFDQSSFPASGTTLRGTDYLRLSTIQPLRKLHATKTLLGQNT